MEKNPDILTLVEKKKRTLPGLLFNRLTLVVALLLLQVLVLLGLFLWFDRWLPSIYGASTIFSLLVILYLLNGRMDPTGKITWLVVIMLLPVFGGLLYLFTERDIGHRAMARLMQKRSDESQLAIHQNRRPWKSSGRNVPERQLWLGMSTAAAAFPCMKTPILPTSTRERTNSVSCSWSFKRRKNSSFWSILSWRKA